MLCGNWVPPTIGHRAAARGTVRALGLHRLHQTIELADTPVNRGMLRRVAFLVTVEEPRAGGGIPAWFEGGQTPLHIRTPKLPGFKNRFRVEYAAINLSRLSDVAPGTLITPDVLRHDGLLRAPTAPPQRVKSRG